MSGKDRVWGILGMASVRDGGTSSRKGIWRVFGIEVARRDDDWIPLSHTDTYVLW